MPITLEHKTWADYERSLKADGVHQSIIGLAHVSYVIGYARGARKFCPETAEGNEKLLAMVTELDKELKDIEL